MYVYQVNVRTPTPRVFDWKVIRCATIMRLSIVVPAPGDPGPCQKEPGTLALFSEGILKMDAPVPTIAGGLAGMY